jgi:hypothetical protein
MMNYLKTLFSIPKQMRMIMIKVNDLAGIIESYRLQLEKVRLELTGLIDNLENSLANVAIPEEAVTALEGLKEVINLMDSKVPDQVVEPTPDEPPVEDQPVT